MKISQGIEYRSSCLVAQCKKCMYLTNWVCLCVHKSTFTALYSSHKIFANCDHSAYPSLDNGSLYRCFTIENNMSSRETDNEFTIWSLIFPHYFEVHPLQYLNEKDKFTS